MGNITSTQNIDDFRLETVKNKETVHGKEIIKEEIKVTFLVEGKVHKAYIVSIPEGSDLKIQDVLKSFQTGLDQEKNAHGIHLTSTLELFQEAVGAGAGPRISCAYTGGRIKFYGERSDGQKFEQLIGRVGSAVASAGLGTSSFPITITAGSSEGARAPAVPSAPEGAPEARVPVRAPARAGEAPAEEAAVRASEIRMPSGSLIKGLPVADQEIENFLYEIYISIQVIQKKWMIIMEVEI